MTVDPLWQPPYSFVEKAAAEAREESRRFWQGRPSYPVKSWKIPLIDSDARLQAAIKRNRGTK